MRITALEPQKKRKNRWNLFLDGQFYCGLDENAVIKLGLKVGQELDEDFLPRLEGEEEQAKAWNSLLFFLKTRDRSEREIVNKLKQKGYTENIIHDLVAKATELNLIDDERFAEMWVRERAKLNPKGKKALKMELKQKGISDDIVEKTFAENVTADDEEALAQKAFEKKSRVLSDMTDPKQKEKMVRYLAGKGFSWDIINRLLD